MSLKFGKCFINFGGFGLELWVRSENKGQGRLWRGGRAGRVAKSMAGITESLTRVKIWV